MDQPGLGKDLANSELVAKGISGLVDETRANSAQMLAIAQEVRTVGDGQMVEAFDGCYQQIVETINRVNTLLDSHGGNVSQSVAMVGDTDATGKGYFANIVT